MTRQGWTPMTDNAFSAGIASAITHRSSWFHFNELELNAVRPFEKAHTPAAGDNGLLQYIDPLPLELLYQLIELVGVNGYVLHAVLLLALLLLEKLRDIELESQQVDAIAASCVLVQDLRAERVHVELDGLV